MAEFTFNSLVKELANNKIKLSEKRFRKTGINEIPRDIYLITCKDIAEFYEPLGFKYAKSRQRMTLKKGEFVFSISFQSSRYNIADENVKVIVHANVSSNKLKKWEKESPYNMFNINPNGHLGGGQIGNLQENNKWLEWNVAFPESRNDIINDIIEKINKLALPFFDKFSNIEKLKDSFIKQGEHYSISAIRFLMYFFSKIELEQTLTKFLTKREFWEKYEYSLKILNKREKVGGTYWDTIAKTKIELDLNLEKTSG